MEFIFLGFGALGLPIIFAYLELRYGYKEILELLRIIPKGLFKIYIWLKAYKWEKRKFELREIGNTDYVNSLKVFAEGIWKGIYDPKNKTIRNFNDIANYIYNFTTYQDNNGISFLNRVGLVIKDKELYERFISLENIIRNTQYTLNNTPWNVIISDLREPLLQLIDKINEYEIEINRIKNFRDNLSL